MLLLQQFDFTVVYKPGTSNGNADCLSRRPTANPPEEPDITSQGALHVSYVHRKQNG